MIVLGAAILAVVATAIWIRLARRLGLLDAPNPIVPQHRAPTAHMGGVAVASAAYGALAIRSLWPGAGAAGLAGPALTLMLAGLAFLLLGMLDDLLRLSARSKFAAQLLIAMLAAAGGVRASLVGQPLADGAIAVLWIVTVVNAVNLTDVCDGLVAGLAAVALLWAAPSQPFLAAWSLAAAGACAGFLIFNAPPARVFLGDAGSHWLGFMVAAAALTAAPAAPLLDATRMALLCGVFLFELLLLIVARTARRIPFWQGSPDHFSLRLQVAGLSRWTTVLLAWGAAAALGALAWRLPALPSALRLALPLVALLAGVVSFAVLLLAIPPPQPQGAAAEPRRLLWFHQNFVSGRQAGNARAMHLVSAMLERGWAVDVVTTDASYLDESAAAEPGPPIEREGRLTIHRLRHGGGPRSRGWSWVTFCVRSLLYAGHFRRVDVVYTSTPPLPQTLVAAVVSWTRRAPLVLEVRDLWPLFLERLGLVRSPFALRPAEWMEAFAYRAARHVISVSPAFGGYLADMGVGAERYTVAPTGVEMIEPSEPERARVRHEQGWDDCVVAIYAGSFNESYEIARLLRAAERTALLAPRVRWVLAGGGRARPAVEAAAARLPNVRYLGGVPRDRLWPLLQAADLGLVSLGTSPVLQLVVPGKLFDYCAAELPVVCTTDGMAGAIVRAAGAGEVLPQASEETLAAAVCRAAERTEAVRREQGRRAREWLLAHMPSDASARAIAAVVEAEAGEAGRSQAAWILRAAAGALADVVGRRSHRAATRLLTAELSRRCEESLQAWLEGGARAPRAAAEALRLPALLTTRGARPAE